jgi:hypothetical protein
VWYGVVWCDACDGVVVWCVVWCGVVWCGVVWCGVLKFFYHSSQTIDQPTAASRTKFPYSSLQVQTQEKV